MSHCHSFDKSDVAKAIRRENISPFKGTLLPGCHEPPLIHRLDRGIFWGMTSPRNFLERQNYKSVKSQVEDQWFKLNFYISCVDHVILTGHRMTNLAVV